MSSVFFSVVLYVFGFVGLAAMALIPLRAWQILRSALRLGKWGFAVLAAFAALTLWVQALMTIKVFNCLIGNYCGPGVASGWSYLALLGGAYLLFEALNYLIRKFNKRLVGLPRSPSH